MVTHAMPLTQISGGVIFMSSRPARYIEQISGQPQFHYESWSQINKGTKRALLVKPLETILSDLTLGGYVCLCIYSII